MSGLPEQHFGPARTVEPLRVLKQRCLGLGVPVWRCDTLGNVTEEPDAPLVGGPNDFVQLIHFTAPSGTDKFFDDRSTRPTNPTRLGLAFKDVTYDIPAGATQLIVEVRARTTWFNEIVGFDNIRVTAGAAVQPVFNAPTIQGGQVELTWTGTGQLQESTTLAPASWSPVPGNPASGFRVDPNAAPTKFYRLVSPSP